MLVVVLVPGGGGGGGGLSHGSSQGIRDRTATEFFMAPSREDFLVWTVALGLACNVGRGCPVDKDTLGSLADLHPSLVTTTAGGGVLVSGQLLRPKGDFEASEFWGPIKPIEWLNGVANRWLTLEIAADGSCALTCRDFEGDSNSTTVRRIHQHDSRNWDLTLVEHALPATGLMLEVCTARLQSRRGWWE